MSIVSFHLFAIVTVESKATVLASRPANPNMHTLLHDQVIVLIAYAEKHVIALFELGRADKASSIDVLPSKMDVWSVESTDDLPYW